MNRKGLLVVLSGPSGSGKGTLLKRVREQYTNIRFSISATTRSPREGEIDGNNYFFVTTDQFKSMIDNDKLVEWVEYCGNYYGTPRQHVEESKSQGFDVVLEIEVEGALNIIKKYSDCVSIFILPPSFEELRRRIEGRGTEKPDVIDRRLERAKKELEFVNHYDYVVINDNIEEAASEIINILSAEKLKFSRNQNILELIGIKSQEGF
jgi:guanylate kinase